MDEIVDLILDLLLIPRDTSVDYEHTDDRFYSRDRYYLIIYDYTLGYSDYTAEEVLDILLSIKEGDSYNQVARINNHSILSDKEAIKRMREETIENIKLQSWRVD